jgi:hypothetical protein
MAAVDDLVEMLDSLADRLRRRLEDTAATADGRRILDQQIQALLHARNILETQGDTPEAIRASDEAFTFAVRLAINHRRGKRSIPTSMN